MKSKSSLQIETVSFYCTFLYTVFYSIMNVFCNTSDLFHGAPFVSGPAAPRPTRPPVFISVYDLEELVEVQSSVIVAIGLISHDIGDFKLVFSLAQLSGVKEFIAVGIHFLGDLLDLFSG